MARSSIFKALKPAGKVNRHRSSRSRRSRSRRSRSRSR